MWEVGVGGEMKVVNTIHWNRKAAIVQNKNSHSVFLRPRQLLIAVKCSLNSVPQWHRILHSGLS